MKYYRHEAVSAPTTVYPLVCMHVGAPQSNDEFIREHLERIETDLDGVAIYMGDAGECTLRGTKGDIWSQYLTPGEQLEYATELLAPLAESGQLLFGIQGNHGNRVYKETGISWDQQLCSNLGIPFLGTAAFVRLITGEVPYDLYFHHGSTSATTTGGKIGKAEKIANNVDADAVFTAHSHICVESQPQVRAYLPKRKAAIGWRMQHNYVCGSGYDSRTGYAEVKAYSPLTPAYLGVTFYGRDNHRKTADESRKQSVQIWRADL